MKTKILVLSLCVAAFSPALLSSCSSTKTYVMPKEDDFQGYRLVDGVDKDTVFVEVEPGEKIAVAIRDISTTAYSFLEPRYRNSMVSFDGKSQCCAPTSHLMGNTGLAVYKFSFIGKGSTSMQIVARQKGLSVTAHSFETDKVFTISAKVKD